MVSDDMINESEEFNAMKIGKGNRSTLKKSGLMSVCPLHIPNYPALHLT
jgi:hypothetical protein